MAKRTQQPVPAEIPGADVAFNFTVGELRTEEIAVPGRKPFSVSFRVPGAGASADLALAASGGSSDDENASRGEAMVRYIAKHLVSWSLPRPATWPKDAPWPNARAVDAINDALVLIVLFRKIREAGLDVKN